MKFISIAAAVLTAATLWASAAAPAEARTHVFRPSHNNSNQIRCLPESTSPACRGYRWRDHRHRFSPNFDFFFGYNPYPWGYDPYYYPYNGYPNYGYPSHGYHYSNAMSCTSAKYMLYQRGYKYVVATDCSGRYYNFSALKSGHKYRITLEARTGRYSTRLIRY